MISRWIYVVLVTSFVSLYGGEAAGIIPDWPQAGWAWAEEQSSDLSGLRLFQRELSAPLAPAEVARTLSARLPQLNRLVVLDGQILLSGVDETHHWLARVRRDAEGTRAVVSALALEVADLQYGKFDAALYVPADSRLQLNHVQGSEGQRIAQTVYESDRSPSALIQQVGHALSQAGWHRQNAIQKDGGLLWRRANEQVHIYVFKRMGSSVLWLQHREAEDQ
ncbi:hypothetical protein KVP09_01905 [Alcaligenaceae bacterium CGII-47]|nr:hypothetical protein [Alcaligenaceae bacterium CGII-47]